MTDPKDVTSSKTVLAVVAAAAFVAGAGADHLGGALLDSPPTPRSANATLLVHAVHIEQPVQGGALELEAYSTTVFALADGGLFKRDNGGRRCVGSAATAKAVGIIEGSCKVGDGWLHVIELRPGGDSGFVIEAYASEHGVKADAADIDLGSVPCAIDVSTDGSALIFQEALACAEQVLDEP